MRSSTPRDLRGHCPRCTLKLEICVCSVLPCVEARTKIVLIRHVTERLVTSNTGRFAALSLPNSELLDYGGGQAFDATSLGAPGSALLYCSGAPRPLSFVPRCLIVLDGSFRQARRMYKRVPALRELPEFTLPAPEVTPTRLRQPTQDTGMSTIEAIATALSLLEGTAVAAPLWALHAELVRRADTVRGRKRAIVSAGP
ncbi:MAG TPA: tRNA-uridine aminocarboxypropyltransferase [Polyangiaceae bacterium]|jgi:DTW domain-containing protein YfiP|nr:tRNA-uridine aminocarboxypropyltransferase [Polyangiaceae bacterium]